MASADYINAFLFHAGYAVSTVWRPTGGEHRVFTTHRSIKLEERTEEDGQRLVNELIDLIGNEFPEAHIELVKQHLDSQDIYGARISVLEPI